MWQFNLDKFSAMLEVWLQFHQLTTDDLSQLTGIAKSTLYAIKKGDYAPSMAQFTAILNATAFPPELFFRKVK